MTTAGAPKEIDQGWAQGGIMNGAALAISSGQFLYGSVFGVTALRGGQSGNIMMDEPMNRKQAGTTFLLILAAVDNSGASSTNCSNAGTSNLDQVSGFRSLHTGGCYFLFCDGSVQFIRESIKPETYRGLSTIAGGEQINAGEY